MIALQWLEMYQYEESRTLVHELWTGRWNRLAKIVKLGNNSTYSMLALFYLTGVPSPPHTGAGQGRRVGHGARQGPSLPGDASGIKAVLILGPGR
jgi:hypothetical protein